MRCGRDITSSEEDCGNCKKAKTVCQYARTPRKRGPIRGHVKELNDRVRALEAKVQGRGLGHEHDGGEVGTSLKGDDGSTGRSRAGSQQQQGMNLSGVSGGDDSFLELQSLPYFNGPGPGQREQQQQQQQFVLPSNHMPGMDQSVMAADASAIGLNTNSSLLAAIANMGSVEATDPQLLIERGVQGAERLLDMLRAAAVEAAAAGSGGEHEMAASASASASASAIGGGIGTRHTGVSSLHSLQHLAELAVGDDRDAERQHAQAIAVAMVSIDKEMRAVKEGVLASIRGGTVRGF